MWMVRRQNEVVLIKQVSTYYFMWIKKCSGYAHCYQFVSFWLGIPTRPILVELIEYAHIETIANMRAWANLKIQIYDIVCFTGVCLDDNESASGYLRYLLDNLSINFVPFNRISQHKIGWCKYVYVPYRIGTLLHKKLSIKINSKLYSHTYKWFSVAWLQLFWDYWTLYASD